MSDPTPRGVPLVGSIPLGEAETVFRVTADVLGSAGDFPSCARNRRSERHSSDGGLGARPAGGKSRALAWETTVRLRREGRKELG